jgi:transcriptional regulator with XRE-family HTH domain
MSNRIAEFRKRKKWNQAQLATAIGYPTRTEISKFENEQQMPKLDVLRRIAQALDCRPYELVMEPEDLQPKRLQRGTKAPPAEQLAMAARLRSVREGAGINSAAEAAKRLGMAYQTYAGHEIGKTGFKHSSAIRYARVFGVDLQWLLTGEGAMTPEKQMYDRIMSRAA